MKMNREIYEDGEYLKNNPSWHTEDSPWKAENILKILRKNEIYPQFIGEIGCGAGEILNQLHAKMEKVELFGYEISEQAFELCKSREKEGLTYRLENLISEDNKDFFDILLVIDIFEHVEDYFSFLRKCQEKATYKVFHIPLDMNVQMVMRMNPILQVRKQVGHLHYFSKDTALATLKDAGYEVLDYFYTSHARLKDRSLKFQIMNIPRKFFYNLNKDLTVRLLGGYSLIVLAK